MNKAPNQFSVEVPQRTLDRISAKLALSQVGYAPADDSDWKYGMSASYLAEFLEHWRNEFDWRKAETVLNQWPQFKAKVDEIDVHFYHIRGSGSGAFPLILTHGWPGSPLEFFGVIERLAYPERFGGSPDHSFDLVIPSLPGYGFSSKPESPIGPRRVAAIWRKLMVETLGYQRFGAQGGDWGSAVTAALGADHADVVLAIHLNLFVGPPEQPNEDGSLHDYRIAQKKMQAKESAYMLEQMTKPQTIGLALSDSPLGFAAWVLEKFHGWGDTNGNIESRFSKDDLITNIMTYLVNDAVISSIWLYNGVTKEVPAGAPMVPVGCALFPREFMPYPPRKITEKLFPVRRWTEMKAGGHFAAFEEPEAFAADVAAFFRGELDAIRSAV